MERFQRGERRGGDRRRHRYAVDEAAGGVAKIIDQRFGADDIAAAGRERLRQGAHPNVDPVRVDSEMLEYPCPACSQHAKAMRIVNHEPRAMAFLDGDQGREIAEVAVHRIEALGHDQRPLVASPQGGKQRVERGHVIMRKGPALAARHNRAHDDAVVRQRIMDDEVARAEQGADRRNVGGVPADIGEARFSLVMASKSAFERADVRAALPQRAG